MSFHFNFIQYLTKKNMEEQLFFWIRNDIVIMIYHLPLLNLYENSMQNK